ncbi:MAG: bifunctional isocitrate dehydrogenase kinase/phosphatase [Chloroflexi bacterium]|nr:bifunctional isocitrate dehydrogenase kinase/phosphatase [Chloroflexota bacterium]MBP8055308.1 bifunctional isocitrate dehydrogenase kinase/phosphatase [Chloroflexota bacterium]
MNPRPAPPHHLTDSRLANMGATIIHDAYIAYSNSFATITHRAYERFAARDWHGHRGDARQRLELYRQVISHVVTQICSLLADRLKNKLVWASLKAVYSSRIAQHNDWELAETFFNSVTRRIFATVGVDPQIEFVATDFDMPPTPSYVDVYRIYQPKGEMVDLVRQVIQDFGYQVPFAHLEWDCQQVAGRIRACLDERGAHITQVDMVKQPFYRGKGAYLVGRIFTTTGMVPLTLALLHEENGIYVDCALLDESSISILFSFARSYFHVETDRPFDLVHFIRSLIPQKRFAEIYISLGYNKHGKTELYRDLLAHLAHSQEQFHITPGQKGMVMTVFTLPDYDLVFKVIKDRFSYPKRTTRQEVMAQYELVFHHDRAGRLIDAQTFEHLQFNRTRFSEGLLEELLQIAARTVWVSGEYVVVNHAYVERRVTPLDLYLQQATPAAAAAAVLDYGQTIKDLAATNIFTGDMLLKNFGVTRHGRLVFYDYDELRPLTDCRFRAMPQSSRYEDELSAEPWFPIGDDDIFPEEFLRFMGLPPVLQQLFVAHHGDLLEVDYWQETQARIRAGEIISIIPYAESQRFPRPG